jgi:hypothetical protein
MTPTELSDVEVRLLTECLPEISFGECTDDEQVVCETLVQRGLLRVAEDGIFLATEAGREALGRKALERHTLEVQLDPIRKAYKVTKADITQLPPSRMKSLALTDLESSFSRACFAVAELFDPIG